MKLLTILVVSIFFSTFSCAQTSVPTAVKEAFGSKYPAAQSVKWEAEDDEFEAEFLLSGKKMEASFSASGVWLETETEIKKSALPALVQQAISQGFQGYAIKEVEQLSTPGWDNAYEVELKKGKEVIEVVFSDSGQVLEKDAEEEEEEDDDEGNG